MKTHENIQKMLAHDVIDKHRYIEQMYEQIHSRLFEYSAILPNTGIKSISITNDGIIAKFADGDFQMKVIAQDRRQPVLETINFNSYEHYETKTMLSLVDDDAVFLDIGANMGYYSCMMASKKKDIQIHSFEPVPQTYQILIENIRLNEQISHKIKPNNFGFSDKNESADIFYYKEGSGNASLKNLSNRDTVFKEKIALKMLDEWACQENIKNVDFIKCDVEGAEFFVLKGGSELISQQKPILFLELLRKWSAPFSYHPNDVLKWLKEFNYKAYVSTSEGLKFITEIDDNTQETNFFFLP